MANALNMRAITLVNEGNPTQGESVAREAVTLHRKVHGEYHPETGWGLFFLGRALEAQEKLDEAEKSYRESVELFGRIYDDDRTFSRSCRVWNAS